MTVDIADSSVIPLQSLGVVDVGATDVADNELVSHAFANTCSDQDQNSFLVKRSSGFVNEYGREDEDGFLTDGGPNDPNHMLGAFPTLWPYGIGGIETRQPISVPYNVHVQFALQYADKRFRQDLHFIFQAFGVLQK